jgi:hypothetical protein
MTATPQRVLTQAEGRKRLAVAMEEATLQGHIVELADTLRYLVFHDVDSRKNRPGFPDLVMVRRGRLIFAELKQQGKRPTHDQDRWLAELRQVAEEFIAPQNRKCHPPLEVYVWRPMDWLDGSIQRVLMLR